MSRLSVFVAADRDYKHFAVSAETLTALVWALCIGVMLAAAYMLYQKRVPGGIVRAVLAAGALSKESAKTAEELGLTGRLQRWELAHNLTLGRVLARTEGEDGTVRYFVPEEEKYRAEVRFSAEGAGPLGFLGCVVLAFALGLLLLWLLPVCLSALDGIL